VERREALDHRIADGTMEAGRFDAAGRRLTDSRRPPLPNFQRDRAAGLLDAACRFRQIPRTASKIAICEVMAERAFSSTSAGASASGSRVRMARDGRGFDKHHWFPLSSS
jgi:hypothetical protein